MTAADRLFWLAMRNVTVTLTPGGRLDVRGPGVVIKAAEPGLRQHKAELVLHLGAGAGEGTSHLQAPAPS